MALAASVSCCSMAFSTWAMKVSARSTSLGCGRPRQRPLIYLRGCGGIVHAVFSKQLVRHRARRLQHQRAFIMNRACGATTVELRSPLGVDGSGRSNAWNISYIELRTTGR